MSQHNLLFSRHSWRAFRVGDLRDKKWGWKRVFLRDDSAADSDTHATRRAGFEPFGRDPLELEANVRKVVGMNPIDNFIVQARCRHKTPYPCRPQSALGLGKEQRPLFLPSLSCQLSFCLLNCHMANEYCQW